jgi:uncharacterized protein (TIGR00251 family)
MSERLRVSIRVRPGATRNAVGGRYGADALVVAVSARAVDGAANRAVVAAVAAAFGVRHSDVEIVAGQTSRSKTVAVHGNRRMLEPRLRFLLGA